MISIYKYIWYLYINIYNGTQQSIKADDYQLAKIDICEHKST